MWLDLREGFASQLSLNLLVPGIILTQKPHRGFQTAPRAPGSCFALRRNICITQIS